MEPHGQFFPAPVPWVAAEEQILFRYVLEHTLANNAIDWRAVCAALPHRSAKQCVCKWSRMSQDTHRFPYRRLIRTVRSIQKAAKKAAQQPQAPSLNPADPADAALIAYLLSVTRNLSAFQQQ